MTLLVWTLLAPLLTAALGAVRASRKVEEVVIVGGLSLTFVLCLATASQFLAGDVPSAFNDALRVDGLSALVLVLCGFVGLLSASYGIGYIRRNDARGLVTPGLRQEFSVLTPLYVFAMLLVSVSNNLGILWIAVELTTLASVFLVAYHNRDTSLEAAWKFLMLGSLGLGFALLGTVLLFASAQGALGEDLPALHWTQFMDRSALARAATKRLFQVRRLPVFLKQIAKCFICQLGEGFHLVLRQHIDGGPCFVVKLYALPGHLSVLDEHP